MYMHATVRKAKTNLQTEAKLASSFRQQPAATVTTDHKDTRFICVIASVLEKALEL